MAFLDDISPVELILKTLEFDLLKTRNCAVDAKTCEALWYRDSQGEDIIDVVENAAATLFKLGACKGKVAGLLIKNDINFLQAWLGSIIVGAVVSPINYHLDYKQIIEVLGITAPDLLIAEESFVWHFEKSKQTLTELFGLISKKFPQMGVVVMPRRFRGSTKYISSDRETASNLWRWDFHTRSAGLYEYVGPSNLDETFEIFCENPSYAKWQINHISNRLFAENIRSYIKAHNLNQDSRSLIVGPLYTILAQYAFCATTLAGGTSIFASGSKDITEEFKRWHGSALL